MPSRDFAFDYGGGPLVVTPAGGWIVVIVVPAAQPFHISQDTSSPRPVASDGSGSDVSLAALAQHIPGAAQSASAGAANQARSTADDTISLASVLASSTLPTQEMARSFNASAEMTWMPAPPIADSAGRESPPAVDPLMEPFAADSDTEGGLIRLDTAQSDEPSRPKGTDGKSDEASHPEDAADLDAFWSDWPDARDLAADEPTFSPATTELNVEILADGEGGLIELSEPEASVDVPYLEYVLQDAGSGDVAPATLEAGVALFQVFELGTLPPEPLAETQSAPAPPPPSEKSDAVEQPQKPAGDKAAIIGVLAAVPLEIRRRRLNGRPPQRPTR